MEREVSMLTDHASFEYLYYHYRNNPGTTRHTASKLMRWDIKLSAFFYVVEHLPGERNVWADMLDRCAINSKRTVDASKDLRASSHMCAPTDLGVDYNMDWPSFDDIKKS